MGCGDAEPWTDRRAILDTLVLGCKEGQFVLRVIRPDGSVRTF
jgi:hypothetical protein